MKGVQEARGESTRGGNAKRVGSGRNRGEIMQQFDILLLKNKAKKKGAGAGNASYGSQKAWMPLAFLLY